MRQIDTVVFDIGNVLIRWDPHNLYRKMGYSDAVTARIMTETDLPRINHLRLDAGADFADTISRLAQDFPGHQSFIMAFHERWEEMLNGAIEENVSILRRLKRGRTPVYAISNFSREKFEIARARFPFLDEFDELVVSGDVGMVKPGAEIFEVLIERRRLDPARAVFIDDSAANIETAARLGFATIHFSEQEVNLRAELAGLGITTV